MSRMDDKVIPVIRQGWVTYFFFSATIYCIETSEFVIYNFRRGNKKDERSVISVR